MKISSVPHKGLLIACVLGLAAGFILARGYYYTGSAATVPLFADRAVWVKVATVHTQPVSDFFEGIGVLQAQQQATITSEVPGVIEQIAFENGACVKQGELLFSLRSDLEKAAWDAADAAAQLADLTRERNRQLLKKGSVSKQAWDEQEADWALKKAQAISARVHWEQRKIRAPFPGCLEAKTVSVGNYVTPGQALVRLVDTARLELHYPLPEQWAHQVHVGDTVSIWPIGVTSQETESFPLTFVGQEVDSQQRTVTVQARIENGEKRWLAGMSVQIRQALTAPVTGLWVPETAVVADLDGYRVWLLCQPSGSDTSPVKPDGTACARKVQIADRKAGWVQIASGLHKDDTVIVAGQEKLREGSALRVQA